MRQAGRAIAEGRIGPRTQEVEFTGVPEVSFDELHDHLTAGEPPR